VLLKSSKKRLIDAKSSGNRLTVSAHYQVTSTDEFYVRARKAEKTTEKTVKSFFAYFR